MPPDDDTPAWLDGRDLAAFPAGTGDWLVLPVDGGPGTARRADRPDGRRLLQPPHEGVHEGDPFPGPSGGSVPGHVEEPLGSRGKGRPRPARRKLLPGPLLPLFRGRAGAP